MYCIYKDIMHCNIDNIKYITHVKWYVFIFSISRHLLENGFLKFDYIVHNRVDRPDEGIFQCVASVDNLGTIVSRKAKLQVACKYICILFLYLPSQTIHFCLRLQQNNVWLWMSTCFGLTPAGEEEIPIFHWK